MSTTFDYGTGRRKTATARTRLYAGSGNIEINGRPVEQYFPRKTLQMIIRQPLVLTKLLDRYDVKVNVSGGGVTGQAEAVRHGISRALLAADPALRPALKRAGFLTRDARKKERKKYGLAAARARYRSARQVGIYPGLPFGVSFKPLSVRTPRRGAAFRLPSRPFRPILLSPNFPRLTESSLL